MTITFSVGMLFRAMLLAAFLPLAVMAYMHGWKRFLDKNGDGEDKFLGVVSWAVSLAAVLGAYLSITLPGITTWNW